MVNNIRISKLLSDITNKSLKKNKNNLESQMNHFVIQSNHFVIQDRKFESQINSNNSSIDGITNRSKSPLKLTKNSPKK